VRLAPVQDGDWLVVGEGIETVASVMVATGYAGWAALSTSGLAGLVLPPNVGKISSQPTTMRAALGRRTRHGRRPGSGGRAGASRS
jgi:hypothetical protein